MTLHVRWPARPASLSRPVGKLRAGLVPIAIGIFGTFCAKARPDYVGNKTYTKSFHYSCPIIWKEKEKTHLDSNPAACLGGPV